MLTHHTVSEDHCASKSIGCSIVTDDFSGGYPRFVEEGFNDNYLPVWLQQAGYNTYYTGKLFNVHTVTNYDSPEPAGFTDSVLMFRFYLCHESQTCKLTSLRTFFSIPLRTTTLIAHSSAKARSQGVMRANTRRTLCRTRHRASCRMQSWQRNHFS